MSWLDKVKAACETFDTVVGGALLKTEQRITSGLTFDEEIELTAPVVGAAIKKAVTRTNDKAIQPVAGAAKKAYAKASEKATPVVEKAKAKIKARGEKAAPAAKVTVVATPDPNVAQANLPESPAVTAYEVARAQYEVGHSMLLNGLMEDMTERLAWIAQDAGIQQGTMTMVTR